MFSINTNIASLEAQNYLAQSSTLQTNTIEQVTSGLRITNSGVDAAGLAIANSYQNDEAVLTQGIANSNQGQGQLQTIDGGLNNITQLLDRASTLATESSSGTFASGDSGRVGLNTEFQSVLQEINRQAQAIGLDSGGQFAKALSVFVGGGTAQGSSTAIQNGSITVDLSKAAVDTKSLGLTGVQAEGTGIDLSAGQSTSVANIISNQANQNSEAASGYTNFTISGPGFSDGGKINLSVNLNGVTDTTSLANAINTAIQAAGQGGTQQATAFANAGINATIVTDSTGAEHLAFNSSSTAFQVTAGDATANALMGKTVSAGSVQGQAVTSTVTASAASSAGSTSISSPTGISLQFQGAGLSAPVSLSLQSSDTTVAAALADLQSQVADNSALKAAGITLSSATAGGALQFTSSSGQAFSVNASGDTNNVLGLGSFLTGSQGAADYTTIQAGSSYDNTTAGGIANFQFSVSGASSAAENLSVDLAGGNATSGNFTGTTLSAIPTSAAPTTVGDTLDVTVDGVAHAGIAVGGLTSEAAVVSAINTAIGGPGSTAAGSGTASFVNDQLVITSNTKGIDSTVAVTPHGSADADLGISTGTATGGTSRTTDNLVAYLNTEISQNATLKDAGVVASSSASGNAGQISFTSSNDSYFRLNTVGNNASVTSDSSATYTPVTGVSDSLNITLNGASSPIAITLSSNDTTAASVAADINSQLTDAQKAELQVTTSNGNLQFNVLTPGAQSGANSSVEFTGDATTVLGLTSGTTTSGTSPDVGFGAASGNSFSGNTASASVDNTFDASGANQLSSTVNGVAQAQALGYTGIAYGTDTQSITITANDSNGAPQSLNVTLGNNSTAGAGGTALRNGESIDQAINSINSQLQASDNSTLQGIVAVKDDSSGTDKIQFLSASNSFQVTVGTTAAGTGATATNASGNSVQGYTASSSEVGAGGTADISNQTSAEAAVTAIANAIVALGNSQSAVGRGENEFTYASNLAQSQLTNETASESTLRDANLAQASATLTKAQILVQAGVAALAQANSAPQQLLTLLQGH